MIVTLIIKPVELLLWLISVALGIAFIYFLYRATFYIKDRWGDFYGAIFVFAVWLFFFRGNTVPTNADINNRKAEQWEFTSKDSVTKSGNGLVFANLGQNTLSTYSMLVKYGVSKSQHNKVPVEIGFIRTGFGDVAELEPASIRLEDVDANDKMEYFIEGTLNWKLLGHVVYHQPKSYHGFAVLK
jgi:hypothetical protein